MTINKERERDQQNLTLAFTVWGEYQDYSVAGEGEEGSERSQKQPGDPFPKSAHNQRGKVMDVTMFLRKNPMKLVLGAVLATLAEHDG